MAATALVIGGTGPTGPGVVNGLVERGYDVGILHTGRREVDTIPPEVPHIHTNPFRIAEVEAALDTALDIVSLPADLATPIRPFLGREDSLHLVTGPDLLMAELGYRDLVPAVDAIRLTAQHLRDHPITRGSTTEMRLQDPFDYDAEDAIVDAYEQATGAAAELAAAYDPDFRDRYAPGSDDWRLVQAKN